MARTSRPSLHLAVLGALPRLLHAAVLAVLTAAAARRLSAGRLAVLSSVLGSLTGLAAYRGLRPPRAPSRTDLPDLRVGAVNLLYSNPVLEQAASSIAARDLDVLVLSECSIDAAAVFSRYFPLIAHTTFGLSGVAVFSRLPADPAGVLQLDDRDLPLVTVHHPRGPVHVVGVHLQAPARTHQIDAWRTHHAALAQHLSDHPGRVVAAGDFNASTYHAPFRHLLAARRGLHPGIRGATFPARFPLLDLDHTVTDLAVLDAARFRVPGSDHLGVEVSMRLPGTRRILP